MKRPSPWIVPALVLLAPLAVAEEVALARRYVGPGPAACLGEMGETSLSGCVFADLPEGARASLVLRDDVRGAVAFTWSVSSPATGLICASGAAHGDAAFTLPPGCTVVHCSLPGLSATTGEATLRLREA